MAFETQSVPDAATRTADVPSPEAPLGSSPYGIQCRNWGSRAGHPIANNPGYLLARYSTGSWPAVWSSDCFLRIGDDMREPPTNGAAGQRTTLRFEQCARARYSRETVFLCAFYENAGPCQGKI